MGATAHRGDNKAYWSSPTAFVLAASAAVIGLGNIWRLPFLAAEFGGGAFLLVYFVALVAMALPLLVAELMLGRGARGDLVSMLADWSARAGLSRVWAWSGYAALLGAIMVLSYYSVIAGWSMAYVTRAAGGALASLDDAGMREQFLQLVGDPEKGLGWHTMFVVVATICAAHGVRRGLEPVSRWLLSAIAVFLVVLVGYAATLDGAGVALVRMLHPDFAALGWRGAIEALHQAFFTLSLGTGVMLAFGAYLCERVSLWRVGIAVLALDTVFAVGVGLAVSALLGSTGIQPADGLKLVFEVVPIALMQSGGGWLAVLFFLMVLLVSLTSAVGLMEPLVVWLRRRAGSSRIFAAAATGLLVWFLGLGTLLSFNLLSAATLFDRTVFEWSSLVSTRIILPLFGVAMCLFAGRFLPASLIAEEWAGTPGRVFGFWRWLLRYPARIGLILVVLYAVGVFSFVAYFW